MFDLKVMRTIGSVAVVTRDALPVRAHADDEDLVPPGVHRALKLGHRT